MTDRQVNVPVLNPMISTRQRVKSVYGIQDSLAGTSSWYSLSFIVDRLAVPINATLYRPNPKLRQAKFARVASFA
jgi:hypothetical protein